MFFSKVLNLCDFFSPCILLLLLFFLFFLGKKSATPKRKLPSKFWPKAAITSLVSECLLRKQEVQADRVPVRVWHDISEALQKDGFTYNFEDCRSKFMTLNEFFLGTVLPKKGTIAGITWNYFEHFLDLHDIPRESLEQLDLSLPDVSTDTPGM